MNCKLETSNGNATNYLTTISSLKFCFTRLVSNLISITNVFVDLEKANN